MSALLRKRKRYFTTKPLVLGLWFFFLIFLSFFVYAQDIKKLKVAYPESIRDVTPHFITWRDGNKMLIQGHFAFLDQWIAKRHAIDLSLGSFSLEDFKSDYCEPFFRKMYGNSQKEVQKKLVTIYWMSNLYGKRYPLRVTTVNGVDKRLIRISEALEQLPKHFHKYVIKPASSFYWRNVAKEKYLSLHSFGIAVDINVDYSNYWLWDLKRLGGKNLPSYHNRIPQEIVDIFEKEGFAWGGHWYHYDTMHFEYRPELFV